MDLQTSKDILPTCYKFKLQKVYYGMNMNQDQKINRLPSIDPLFIDQF